MSHGDEVDRLFEGDPLVIYEMLEAERAKVRELEEERDQFLQAKKNLALLAKVRELEDQITMHEEANGALADTAKAARDAAEWMRAEILTLADDPRYATPSGPAPAALRRIAAGPPKEET